MSRPPFPSLRVAGSLLSTELFTRVLEDDDLAGREPASYGLAPHENVREAASRAFDYLGAAWKAFTRERDRAVAEGRPLGGLTRDRWLLTVFRALDYGILPTTPAGGIRVEDRAFKVSHIYGQVPIHLLGWAVDLDHRTKGVIGAADAAPQSIMQELLNRTEAHLWGIVANGQKLRLLRDSRSLTGSAYVEFDLELIFDEQLYSDFVLLFRLVHASRLSVATGQPPASCWLEKWRTAAIEQGERALAGLREGVEKAITTLGTGFLRHPANTSLRERLALGTLSGDDYKRTVLRLVYRLLFWFVAEDREVLLDPDAPADARRTYTRFFSSRLLRERARRVTVDHHDDLWEAIRIVFVALGIEHGRPELGLPGIGGLFERLSTDEQGRPLPLSVPDALDEPLENVRIANQDLLGAIHHLSVISSVGLRQVDFRHLGAEELGSVYESLLELHPSYDPHAQEFSLVRAAGNERKSTGSYYTPSSLTELLLDNALDPVLTAAARTPGNTEDKVAALLTVTVCDPACGSGHFLVAAARRIARRIAQLRSGEEEPAPCQVRAAMREVVSRCIYGVDINEMAAELARISLWLESVEPGRPLPFLDANIRIGNSLLGTTPELISAGIPKAAFKPLPGDDKAVARAIAKRNDEDMRGAYDLFTQGMDVSTDQIAKHTSELVRTLPARLADVHIQRRRLREIDAERVRAKRVADAWCAAFVQEKALNLEPFAITRSTLNWIADEPATDTQRAITARVDQLSREYRFFHWHVEFPHIFTGPAGGGFACVIGNPPWERVKLQEQEFFASRNTAIAQAKNAAERKKLIAALPDDSPLRSDFEAAVRASAGTTHLIRSSGHYPFTGVGDVNTYSVFAETMRAILLRSGQMGVITPTGLATDATTAAFFGDTLRAGRLAAFYDFENEAKIFPGVHNQFRFALTVITGGERVREVAFAFYTRHVADVPQRRFGLTPNEVLLLNPNTGTLPVFRTRADAEITLGIYRRHPLLIREGDAATNPWGLSFATLFHMANDSDLFRDTDAFVDEGAVFDGWSWVDGEQRWLPLYEAKLLSYYDHRSTTYAGAAQAQLNKGTLPHMTDAEHADPYAEPLARYWVDESAVAKALADARDPQHRPRWERDWFLGWRDIARASDARTFIPCVLPNAAVGHVFPVAFFREPLHGALLQAIWSSMICDFVVRQKISGTHLTYGILNQLACPVPETFEHPAPWAPREALTEFVVARVLELAYTSHRIVGYARDLGDDGPPFRWVPERREQIRAELDAAMFHVYGLSRAEAEHVLDSFFVVRKYEMRDHGEFRTKRLVLDRYDAMAEAIRTGVPYQTPLDPPPGRGPRHPAKEAHSG